MMASHPIQLKLSANVTIKPERGKLYKADITAQQKIIKERRQALMEEEAKLRKLFSLQAKANGLDAAYIQTSDLVHIIEDLLLTRSSVSKAFTQYEQNYDKCTRWADRTIKHRVDKDDFEQAVNYLFNKGNRHLKLMSQYNILDIKSMASSDTYRSGLNKLKKQLSIALKLQDKDDQLAEKTQLIYDKDIQIKKLNEELVRNKSNDWKHEAIRLKKSGVTVTEIAKRVSKGRTTISNYLNSAEGIKGE